MRRAWLHGRSRLAASCLDLAPAPGQARAAEMQHRVVQCPPDRSVNGVTHYDSSTLLGHCLRHASGSGSITLQGPSSCTNTFDEFDEFLTSTASTPFSCQLL